MSTRSHAGYYATESFAHYFTPEMMQESQVISKGGGRMSSAGQEEIKGREKEESGAQDGYGYMIHSGTAVT